MYAISGTMDRPVATCPGLYVGGGRGASPTPQGRVGPRDASARTRGAPLVRTVQGGAGQRVGCKGRRDCFCSLSSSRLSFRDLGPVLRVRRVRIRVIVCGTSAARSTAGARRADDQTANDQRTFSTYMNVRGFCGPGGSRVGRGHPWGLSHDCPAAVAPFNYVERR